MTKNNCTRYILIPQQKIIEVCNEETEDGIPDEEIANWLVQDLWNANLVEEVEV